jgi:hypothetical protein
MCRVAGRSLPSSLRLNSMYVCMYVCVYVFLPVDAFKSRRVMHVSCGGSITTVIVAPE